MLQNSEEIKQYTPEEMIDELKANLFYTDVIIDSYEISETFSSDGNIIYTGLCASRMMIENMITWIEENLLQEDNFNKEDSL
jgi:hypothetical protein